MKKLTIIFLLSVSACASSGTKVEQSSFSAFQKGKSTCAEIEAQLGRPSQRELRDNGDVVIYYSYVAAQSHPENFIPIIGAFVRGYDTESTIAGFKCNSSGVLIKTAYLGSAQGSGHNMESVSQERKDTGIAQ